MNYKKLNNIGGWISFTVALVVYLLTVEPTASFWDCGEFIATSNKLEVPHPPGAPFFLLIGRLFSMLAMGDVLQVAYWVNVLSVLSSAFTVLFLFWTISHLARKILKFEEGKESITNAIIIFSAAFIGAFSFTFSDSFWFSAVEAEVYAMSSFFTAFVFWAILKWENISDKRYSNQWLVMIAYMMGLSIGVHLLNLVTIPALALIIYFKRTKTWTWGGIVFTMVLGLLFIILVNNIIIPGLPSVAGAFEIYFVNGLGLPFNTGWIFFVFLFIVGLVFLIFFSEKKKWVSLNTLILSITMILIGYSSYVLVLIRSNYDTPIDENNPEDLISYISYLKREQYGNRPLLSGQYFTAPNPKQTKGDPIYMKGEDEYVVKDWRVDYEYDQKHTTILPRMYSPTPQHIQQYREWAGLREGQTPKFIHNLKFMFNYQLGHMYMRYFMWNFSGRASDIQGADFLTPFNYTRDLPSELANNKGRNHYWGLPLLLGLLGFFIQMRTSKEYFGVTLLLFILTGVALVIYLNSPPVEPRERDYIYSGSYYVFAIWIGLGVISLYEIIKGFLKKDKIATMSAFFLSLGIPTIMVIQNWDDHDRSGRYFSVDSARNYLESCAPNAILFTGGDNDTFPLWYVQEVEEFRQDVRVVVLSYFNTDWYIEQMTRQAYESEPLPFGLELKHYQQGGLNDFLPVVENPRFKGKAINTASYLEYIKREHPSLRVPTATNAYNSIPARQMVLTIDTLKEWKNSELSLVPQESIREIAKYYTDQLSWKVKGAGLEKKDLAIIDLIANNNWKRPIYFNTTSLRGISMDLDKHVVQEGLTYRLMPIDYNMDDGAFLVNTEIMYNNLMNKFSFRGLNDPKTYSNERYRNFTLNHRSAFNTLAGNLLIKGDTARALKVINRCLEVMPDKSVPYDLYSVQQIPLLFDLGSKEQALNMARIIGDRAIEWVEFTTEKNGQSADLQTELRKQSFALRILVQTLRNEGEDELAEKYINSLSMSL